MTAVHVQLREDAELGAAWRRCEAVLPQDSILGFTRHPGNDSGRHCLVYRASLWDEDVVHRDGDTLVDALNALADALEARRSE